jgi:hypothetical protein
VSEPVWAPAGADPDAHPAGAASAPADGRGGGARREVAVVLGCYLVLGVLCGVLWWLLAPEPQFTKAAQGGEMGELELGKQFGIDGWYVVVAGIAGGLSGLVLAWWRDHDPVLTAGLLLVGSGLAATAMALVGHLLGPGDAQAALASAPVGAQVPAPLDVDAVTVYLAWPITVLVGALVVLWGRLPDAEP